MQHLLPASVTLNSPGTDRPTTDIPPAVPGTPAYLDLPPLKGPEPPKLVSALEVVPLPDVADLE